MNFNNTFLDDSRFEKTTFGTSLYQPKEAVLNNRTESGDSIILTESPKSSDIKIGNTDGRIYLTNEVGENGVMFLAPLTNNKSFFLTYWEWGTSSWAE